MELDRTRERGPDADLQAITSPVTLAHAANFFTMRQCFVRQCKAAALSFLQRRRPGSSVVCRLPSTIYRLPFS